jgi:hypothetical protein
VIQTMARYLFLLSGFYSVAAFASAPDPMALSLFPLNIQIVNGTSASPVKTGLRSFLVFRTENVADLLDFRGLVGIDGQSKIRQVFLLAGHSPVSEHMEHSLIALGRFNRGLIYRSARQNGARQLTYIGRDVLEIAPFDRDKLTVNEVRWLAVIEPNLVMFGTVSHVMEELDRLVAHSTADPILLHNLECFQQDDEAWYLFGESVEKDAIFQTLALLDPQILALRRAETSFQFGIHYSRRIRFDYESDTRLSNPQPKLEGSLEFERPKSESVFHRSDCHQDKSLVNREFTTSKARYLKWLSILQAQTPDR